MALLFSYKDVDVYPADVECLKDRNWLNDTCISYSFKRIEDSLRDFASSISLMDPSVVSFMRIQATDDEDNEELATALDVKNKKWLLVPVNDSDSFESASTHWSLIACHIPSGNIYHFDSSSPSNTTAAKKTATRLEQLLSRTSHTLREVDCPRQTNSSDCGVFTVLFTKCICEFLREQSRAEASDAISTHYEALQRILHAKIGEREATEFRKEVVGNIKERAVAAAASKSTKTESV